MFRKLTLPLLAITLLLWVVGCSDNPVDTDAVDNPNLEDEFGGYTAMSEAPAPITDFSESGRTSAT